MEMRRDHQLYNTMHCQVMGAQADLGWWYIASYTGPPHQLFSRFEGEMTDGIGDILDGPFPRKALYTTAGVR